MTGRVVLAVGFGLDDDSARRSLRRLVKKGAAYKIYRYLAGVPVKEACRKRLADLQRVPPLP